MPSDGKFEKVNILRLDSNIESKSLNITFIYHQSGMFKMAILPKSMLLQNFAMRWCSIFLNDLLNILMTFRWVLFNDFDLMLLSSLIGHGSKINKMWFCASFFLMKKCKIVWFCVQIKKWDI